MPATEDRIELEAGKYTFYVGPDGVLRCDRYGEAWPAFQPSKAMLALYHALRQARADLARTHGALNRQLARYWQGRAAADPDETRADLDGMLENARRYGLPISPILGDQPARDEESSMTGSADLGPCAICGGPPHAGECR